jgi:hypothetical protein
VLSDNVLTQSKQTKFVSQTRQDETRSYKTLKNLTEKDETRQDKTRRDDIVDRNLTYGGKRNVRGYAITRVGLTPLSGLDGFHMLCSYLQLWGWWEIEN